MMRFNQILVAGIYEDVMIVAKGKKNDENESADFLGWKESAAEDNAGSIPR